MDAERTEMAPSETSEIGLILVHGIGEQGRFEHLDTHIRGIIGGLRRYGEEAEEFSLTVEIMSADTAAFHSGQDTWRGGPEASIRLVVSERGRTTVINVHEVWWADINEQYSVMKQVRFWFWGLSVWTYPGRPTTKRATESLVWTPPATNRWWFKYWVRARLFVIGCMFLMSSMTAGLFTVLAMRLLNVRAFGFIKTFANYLSSVKLYVQPERSGPAIGSNADYLDTIAEPPRNSIRRRMIRTIADVACREQPYQRWYVLAHSQGSVVAFNGLMEPGVGWPGYLDQKRFENLAARGFVKQGQPIGQKHNPPRPIWSRDGESVDRAKLFANFAGLLTYGSPLEKFAAIWPGTVPVFQEDAFKENTQWVNVFDPIDSVSGVICTWNQASQAQCPKVSNIGYAPFDVLLAGHVKYLDCPYTLAEAPSQERLADHVARWLLGDGGQFRTLPAGERFYAPGSPKFWQRTCGSAAQWVGFFALATVFAALIVPRYSYGWDIFSHAAWADFTWPAVWVWCGRLVVLTALGTLCGGALAHIAREFRWVRGERP